MRGWPRHTTIDVISRMRYSKGMKIEQPDDLAAQLKKVIAGSGLTMFKIAESSCLRYQTVYGSVKGNRDIALSSASKLAALFGLELRPVRRKRKA